MIKQPACSCMEYLKQSIIVRVSRVSIEKLCLDSSFYVFSSSLSDRLLPRLRVAAGHSRSPHHL